MPDGDGLQLGGLLEAAPDAIVAVDGNGDIVLVNAQAERLFGYHRDELIGQKIELLVPDDVRAVHPTHRHRYVDDPQPRPMGAGMELAGRRRDGSQFPAEISLSAVDVDGLRVVAAAIRDVTTRRRADARFRGLLEAAPDAMVCVDAEGRIVVVNAQAERLFGWGRDQLVGELIEILVPDHVRSVHPGHRGSYVADPEPRPMGAGMELSGRRRDGTEFPAEISLSAFETDEGVLVSAAIRDVTERKRAAEAISELASIVQSSHDAIIGKGLDGTIRSWNPGAERLYGYTAAEIVGMPVSVLVPPDRRAHEAAILTKIATGERVEQFETERLRQDGTIAAVSVTVSPITDGTGAITGVASVSRDISERQRADARFRGLLEAAPDAMVCVDADGRIAVVNAQAERLFGYRREDLVGQPIELLVPEQARHLHPAHRSGYFADPRSRPMGAGMELAARRADGTEFPAEISLSALETDEGVLVSAAVRDVTERVEAQAERERLKAHAEREKLERQLHQSQRLESLGQLAGGVAHDFNNLLGAIINYAHFVGEEVAAAAAGDTARPWETVRRDVQQIQLATERATGLTHQLLAFARREVVHPQVLDLDDVVTNVEELLRRTLGEHIELTTDLGSDHPIKADPGQIEQVLVNLAVNGRDAMPDGGTLTIQTATIWVDAAYAGRRTALRPGRYTRLRCSDTGIGMTQDVIDRAFEPFFTTKPKGEGSGLGLATVYGIVTQADGFVEIYSEPGLGTTISALFPVTDDVAHPIEQPPELTRSSGGETVLVVEDEELMREVTTRILNRNGYTVIAAASGLDALAAVKDHLGPIHLLLTDVVMPKMLGKEVAERVTAMRPDLRVLFMSGYAQPILGSHGSLEPGVTLLEKPFSEPILLAKIREVLDA